MILKRHQLVFNGANLQIDAMSLIQGCWPPRVDSARAVVIWLVVLLSRLRQNLLTATIIVLCFSLHAYLSVLIHRAQFPLLFVRFNQGQRKNDTILKWCQLWKPFCF